MNYHLSSSEQSSCLDRTRHLPGRRRHLVVECQRHRNLVTQNELLPVFQRPCNNTTRTYHALNQLINSTNQIVTNRTNIIILTKIIISGQLLLWPVVSKFRKKTISIETSNLYFSATCMSHLCYEHDVSPSLKLADRDQKLDIST